MPIPCISIAGNDGISGEFLPTPDQFQADSQLQSSTLMEESQATRTGLLEGDPASTRGVVSDRVNFVPLASDLRAFRNFQFEFDAEMDEIDDTIQYYRECSNLDNGIMSDDTNLDVYTLAAALNSSPLRPEMFEKWLRRYHWFDKAQILYDLKFGVRIPSGKQAPEAYVFHNHPSVFDNEEKVSALLESRIVKGIIAGPYETPPPGIILSPLAAIPKKEEGKISSYS